MPTPDFGLCLNQDCVLCYCKIPKSLSDQIGTVDAKKKRNEDTSKLDVALKEAFARFFQFTFICSECGRSMYRATLPGPEFDGLNDLLQSGTRLRAKGLLSHP